MNRWTQISAVILIILFVVVGCGQKSKTYGDPIAADTEITAVKDVFSEMEAYDGKTVKIEGEIVRECPSGCWLDVEDVRKVTDGLIACSYEERVAEPCIGRDRADLVLAGCAILEALLRMWPCAHLRVADRGLREGILAMLMAEDGLLRQDQRGHNSSRHRG